MKKTIIINITVGLAICLLTALATSLINHGNYTKKIEQLKQENNIAIHKAYNTGYANSLKELYPVSCTVDNKGATVKLLNGAERKIAKKNVKNKAVTNVVYKYKTLYKTAYKNNYANCIPKSDIAEMKKDKNDYWNVSIKDVETEKYNKMAKSIK